MSLPLGFRAVVSRFSAGVFCVFFFSLLCERAWFLAEASDSFGFQVSHSDVVTLWDESGFSLGPLSRSDLRIPLAAGSPFGTSSGLVAIRSPSFSIEVFHLCPSAGALALSPLWVCVFYGLFGSAP